MTITRTLLDLGLASVGQWLAGNRLICRMGETLFRASLRPSLARWDHNRPGRDQARILLGYIHKARQTPFGREHDFRRIRSVADFRRLVPVRSWVDLWRGFWQSAYPNLADVTWPGSHPTISVSPIDPSRPVVLSPALQESRRSAVRTALELAALARPGVPLLNGHVLFLEDAVNAIGELPRPDKVLAAGLPWPLSWCRQTVIQAVGERPHVLADRVARLPVTCVVGSAGSVAALVGTLKDLLDRDSLNDIWPGLAAVIASVRPGDFHLPRLREHLGPKTLLLESHFRPEAPVAMADPRHPEGLRLLTNHGVFFEFVPEEERGQPNPTRHGVEEVEPGVRYEVAVTSPAGLWACRVGLTVCFEKRGVLRLVEPAPVGPAVPARTTRRDQAVVTSPAQPPHRPGAGIPAGRPGSSFHTPWSAFADRG